MHRSHRTEGDRGEPTNGTHETWEAASEILGTRPPAGHLPVRLLGVGVSGFEQTGQSQGLLFDQDDRQKHEQLDAVVDQIKDRFGGDALRRASGIRPVTADDVHGVAPTPTSR